MVTHPKLQNKIDQDEVTLVHIHVQALPSSDFIPYSNTEGEWINLANLLASTCWQNRVRKIDFLSRFAHLWVLWSLFIFQFPSRTFEQTHSHNLTDLSEDAKDCNRLGYQAKRDSTGPWRRQESKSWRHPGEHCSARFFTWDGRSWMLIWRTLSVLHLHIRQYPVPC